MKLFSNRVSVCMNVGSYIHAHTHQVAIDNGCLVNRNVVNKTFFRNNISCTNRLLFLSAKV
jgi:hypothetical protein